MVCSINIFSRDEDLPINFAENVEYQFSKNEYFKKIRKNLAIRQTIKQLIIADQVYW